FRVPQNWAGDEWSFSYGGTGLGFNPCKNSLFMLGDLWLNRFGEMSIPATLGTGPVTGLPKATLLQYFTDITEGRIYQINPADANNKLVGGILPWGTCGKLHVTGYSYYDGNGSTAVSNFVKGSQDFAKMADIAGPFTVGVVPAGMVGGYMLKTPAAWVSLLGGPALIGQCCLAIASRTSMGPALFAFDPDTVGVTNPAPAVPLVYYPNTSPLGPYNSNNQFYNGTAQYRGVVLPNGTRSVLVFGNIGTGRFCYGPGTTNLAQDGEPVGGGSPDTYCYDLADSSKGTHGWPYKYRVLAYDANDLAAVAAKQKQPWQITPYAAWYLTLPYAQANGGALLGGATYDEATGRIFISQERIDPGNNAPALTWPVVHVFSIAGLGGTTTPPPPPPPTCSDPTATNVGGPLPCTYPAPPPPPPPPPAIVVRSTMTVKTCTLVLEDDPPDTNGGWSVVLY